MREPRPSRLRSVVQEPVIGILVDRISLRATVPNSCRSRSSTKLPLASPAPGRHEVLPPCACPRAGGGACPCNRHHTSRTVRAGPSGGRLGDGSWRRADAGSGADARSRPGDDGARAGEVATVRNVGVADAVVRPVCQSRVADWREGRNLGVTTRALAFPSARRHGSLGHARRRAEDAAGKGKLTEVCGFEPGVAGGGALPKTTGALTRKAAGRRGVCPAARAGISRTAKARAISARRIMDTSPDLTKRQIAARWVRSARSVAQLDFSICLTHKKAPPSKRSAEWDVHCSLLPVCF